jgi:heterodisulfide reductase subunit A-like polyferredoxin
MARIGIFIDGLEGSMPLPFREKITAMAKDLPGVAFCAAEENLTSSEALRRMARELREKGADRAVIIGGSPKIYESSFLKWGTPFPLNPYLLVVANITDQALWAMVDEKGALEKARRVVEKTLRMVTGAAPIESQSLPLKPEALIIGGGIVGLSIASALARSGIHVFLLEKRETLGGRVSELRRFYNRPDEVRQWMEAKISEVEKNSNITLLIRSRLTRLDGHLGRFQAKIQRHDGSETILTPSAIAVAMGVATQRETGGIFTHKRIMTHSDMERLLEENEGIYFLWDAKPVQTVTYLLDNVNEDIQVDSIHAIKQSLFLKERFNCQVAILCKDVKVAADGMERLYRKAREKGVLFIKYDEPPRLSIVNGHIQVNVKETAAIRKEDQWPVSILSDLVVMSEAFIPDPETQRLAHVLRIHLGTRGFLMEDNPQYLRVRSNRRGIFVAGACRFPQEVSESLIEARAVAEEIIALLSPGMYSYDLAIAEVDPKKCAVCYTCPRLCPHSAISVEKYADQTIYATFGTEKEMKWGAARVDPVACYGCGICVAECPARAITLRHLTDEQMYAQMNLLE